MFINGNYNIIGCAVSGGADSMVMLDMLIKKGYQVKVINIEHGIRGEESIKDSKFVEDYCNSLNIPFLQFRLDVKGYSELNSKSIELSARELRYSVFQKLLDDKVVDVIALAHHMDDNSETILMNLFRGAGVKGLSGINDRIGFIHPLLNYTRKRIEEYAKENNIPFVTDSTNLQNDYTRNYIRNKVIPKIKDVYPDFVKCVCRTAENLTEIDEYLNTQIVTAIAKNNTVFLPISIFDMHPIISKLSLKKALFEMGAVKDIESCHLNSLFKLKDAKNNSIINLPFGIDAAKEYDKIIFYRREDLYFEEHPFKKDIEFCLGCTEYSIEEVNKIEKGVFDISKIPKNAVVRLRKNGDKFKRYGGGTKSLNDYYTDIKMPKRIRDTTPVLAVGNVVLCVVGVEISDDIKVDKETVNMFIWKMRVKKGY